MLYKVRFWCGAFLMSTHTANQTTAAALEKTMELINRLQIVNTTSMSAKKY